MRHRLKYVRGEHDRLFGSLADRSGSYRSSTEARCRRHGRMLRSGSGNWRMSIAVEWSAGPTECFKDGQIVEVHLARLVSLTELAQPLCRRHDDWVTVDPAFRTGIGSVVEDLVA